MANMRNKWEFYGSILEALGVDYTDAELKNNETLRAKLLEGLGVEHTYDDVNQYPLWREKLVEGVGNMSGGGGGSSDFSTAKLTLTRGKTNNGKFYVPILMTSPAGTSLFPILNDVVGTNEYDVVVYTDGTILVYDGTHTLTVEGDIQVVGGGTYLITGDCTITIS